MLLAQARVGTDAGIVQLEAKTIVVVDKDAEAPIFEIAEFGVVGDLFGVAPQLTEEIAKRKS